MSRVHRTQSVSALFCQFFYHLPSANVIASYEYWKNECVQQWNLFKCQTSTSCFSTYCPNLFKHIETHWSDRMRDVTAAIDGSVVKITHWPGLFSSTTLSRPQANFLHQTCIAGFVKHLSPYTGRIDLRVNGIWATSFCPEKMNNRTLFLTGCFQQ